jgi:hypothetical protein
MGIIEDPQMQNVALLAVKPNGTFSYHWVLNG